MMPQLQGAITVFFYQSDDGRNVGTKICTCSLTPEQKNDPIGLSGCLAMVAVDVIKQIGKITDQSFSQVLMTLNELQSLRGGS